MRNWPSRVANGVPVPASFTMKKPLPERPRSVTLPVLLRAPWLKLVWMLESCTPVPTWMADWLEVVPLEGAEARRVLLKLSAKVACELL